jgi:hypothetical protein
MELQFFTLHLEKLIQLSNLKVENFFASFSSDMPSDFRIISFPR